MEVPELRNEDISFIISEVEFPPHAPTPRNPVDFAGSNRTAAMEANVLNKLAQLDYIDAVISNAPMTFRPTDRNATAEQIKLDTEAGELLTAIPQKFGKPVVTLGFGGFHGASELQKTLDETGILSYPTPEEAVRAMYTLMKYAEIKRQFTEEQTVK